jgi:hypothetical protein
LPQKQALDELQEKHDLLDITSKEMKAQAEATEARLRQLDTQLCNARQVVQYFDESKADWRVLLETRMRVYKTLVGDMLVAAGIETYLGCWSLQLRQQAIAEWTGFMQSEYGIEFGEKFDAIRVMSTTTQRRLWKLVGVPQNDFSLMNAAILARPSRWPLVIDPQGMTVQYMMRLEEAAGRKVECVTSGEHHLDQVLDPAWSHPSHNHQALCDARPRMSLCAGADEVPRGRTDADRLESDRATRRTPRRCHSAALPRRRWGDEGAPSFSILLQSSRSALGWALLFASLFFFARSLCVRRGPYVNQYHARN